jgi:hypothetical protein
VRVQPTTQARQGAQGLHGVKLGKPGWGEHSHSLAFEAQLRREGLLVYLILNAYSESLEFQLPLAGEGAGSCSNPLKAAVCAFERHKLGADADQAAQRPAPVGAKVNGLV